MIVEHHRSGTRFAVYALATGLLWLGACSAGPPARDAADLTNSRLRPAYAQWLVGPIAAMATPEEEQEFLALEDDFAAADFIEAFWSRRDPDPSLPGNAVRETFERRVEEADRLFGESGVSGRKTARGVIHVLYGEPERTDYEIPRNGGPAVEVWFYPEDAPAGLDGRPPDGSYRFQKVGDVTDFYRPGGPPPRPQGPR
jgi:GWxTD domain-containing protein